MSQLINIALSQYGVTEIVGYQHNPIVLNYFKEIGHTWVSTDETAWCSAFINWVALKAKVQRSNKLTARSWLQVGTDIKEPKLNDVVVFWRSKKASWKGHVGLFISYSEDKKYIYVLGGNQSNQVNIKKYPVYRLLGFRRLTAINS
ncbi:MULTISPECIES: TIGR02594 family protein [Flavobacteriaceae]|jgi:uncharacterized protein (TIGR02594 family)|uniref:TIGR02594 family protein n=1 Tax=Flavobacteriaceae TaxID=49546 RepID=UPI0011A318F5|nr:MULTISPECIES: TIGR02594 family protein [Flavobacteriaceae]TVZ49902.1 uncharacterized protein (TIGR02594 family) [Olleya sp. Hel_I_94]|tara:strand:- start:2491 stop:2928 length:438 start_codon:yes stop_codon:yes gene_type:complete